MGCKISVPELACRHVDAGNIDEAAELAVVMVLQEGKHGDDARRCNQDLQFISCSSEKENDR